MTRLIVEVLRSSKYKYEVVRVDGGVFSSDDFYVLCEGRQVAGAYKDLRDAAAWARRQGAS